jgi:hypothetical protein
LGRDPWQAYTLGFDPTTFSSNFNVMTILYVLPLVGLLPMIPLKARCLKDMSIIETG